MKKTPEGYEKLQEVFDAAMVQASAGKGKERHASGEPFHEQPICIISKWVGVGAALGQAIKKARESYRLLKIKGKDAAKFELLGAINWLAAAIIVIEDSKSSPALANEDRVCRKCSNTTVAWRYGGWLCSKHLDSLEEYLKKVGAD